MQRRDLVSGGIVSSFSRPDNHTLKAYVAQDHGNRERICVKSRELSWLSFVYTSRRDSNQCLEISGRFVCKRVIGKHDRLFV
jgi:hypothetical protein